MLILMRRIVFALFECFRQHFSLLEVSVFAGALKYLFFHAGLRGDFVSFLCDLTRMAFDLVAGRVAEQVAWLEGRTQNDGNY
jgi:hypothetical protein